MLRIVSQGLAAVLLGGAMWLAYRKWVKPYATSLDLQQRGALLLILLALGGGFVGSPFWWLDLPASFSWDLPPLASRMLASAGWSFFVMCLLVLQRPTFRRVRLAVLLLFVYLVPLALAILLFHLDRFDPGLPITYAFFGIVIAMSVASTWYLWRPPASIVPDTARDVEPPGGALRTWLLTVAVLTGLWGVALFITDRGPSDLIWVWPGDLLSSRLIGVMLLTIAAGSLYSLRTADTARIMLATTVTYALGLAVASLWNLVAGKPIKPAYLVVFGVIFLASLALLVWERTQTSRVTAKFIGSD